jgi:hypothetical protein
VYNSTPYPQWSSGYDFRLSFTPTSRGRPGFDSLLRSIQYNDSSSIVKVFRRWLTSVVQYLFSFLL